MKKGKTKGKKDEKGKKKEKKKGGGDIKYNKIAAHLKRRRDWRNLSNQNVYYLTRTYQKTSQTT